MVLKRETKTHSREAQHARTHARTHAHARTNAHIHTHAHNASECGRERCCDNQDGKVAVRCREDWDDDKGTFVVERVMPNSHREGIARMCHDKIQKWTSAVELLNC